MSVNDRLKKLIQSQDDEDYETDRNAGTSTAVTDSPNLSSQRRSAATFVPSSNPQSQPTAGHTSNTAFHSTSTPPSLSAMGITGREAHEVASSGKTATKQGSPKTGRTTGQPNTRPVNQSQQNTAGKPESGVGSGTQGEEGGGEGEIRGKGGEEARPVEHRFHLLAVLGVLIPHMKYTLPETRMETLRWLMWLHQQLPKRVSE